MKHLAATAALLASVTYAGSGWMLSALTFYNVLAVAGAAYDGVGVPACVASGARAAGEVMTHLAAVDGQRRQSKP